MWLSKLSHQLSVQVPLDYSDPTGRSAAIALARKPALVDPTDPSYKGPLIINPGGPGGSGVDFVIAGGRYLSSVVGPQFDIVGFDPRGS